MPALLSRPRQRRAAPAARIAPAAADVAPLLTGGTPRLTGIPLSFTQGPAANNRAMAECAVRAGLIRDVRQGEDLNGCLLRSLAARIRPLLRTSEGFTGDLLYLITDEPDQCRRDDGGQPVDECNIEVHRSENLGSRIIGPRLMQYERQRKGSGKAVWHLMATLWDRHGPGMWSTMQARYEAERFHWHGESDETEAIRQYRDESGDEYKGKTDDEVCEECGIPRARTFRHPKDWHYGTRPTTDIAAYPRELRAEVKAALAVLSRIPPLLAADPEPHMHRSILPRGTAESADLNAVTQFEYLSHTCRPPVSLQWEEDDPCYRVYDDAQRSDYESGEMAIGWCAAFPFSVGNPASLAHAVQRCELFCEVMEVATALTLKASTTTGRLADILTQPEPQPQPVQQRIQVTV